MSEHQVDIYEWFASFGEPAPNKQFFCNDEKINQIVNDIEQTWERIKNKFPPLKSSEKEYAVWNHVPNLGPRLRMIYAFDCEFHNDASRYCTIGLKAIYNLFECERMIGNAKKKGIELSIGATPSMIFISTLDATKSKKKKGDIEQYE